MTSGKLLAHYKGFSLGICNLTKAISLLAEKAAMAKKCRCSFDAERRKLHCTQGALFFIERIKEHRSLSRIKRESNSTNTTAVCSFICATSCMLAI
jgi:hypothetical protein